MDYDERKAPVLAVSDAVIAKTTQPVPTIAAPVESNARILESHKELEIKDAHTRCSRAGMSKACSTTVARKRKPNSNSVSTPPARKSQTGPRRRDFQNRPAPGNLHQRDQCHGCRLERFGQTLYRRQDSRANLPGVDIGSTIEVEYQIATKGKPFISGFENFQTFDDLDKKEFQLTAPRTCKSKPFLRPRGIVKSQTNSAHGRSKFHLGRAKRQSAPRRIAASSRMGISWPEWITLPVM